MENLFPCDLIDAEKRVRLVEYGDIGRRKRQADGAIESVVTGDDGSLAAPNAPTPTTVSIPINDQGNDRRFSRAPARTREGSS